MDPIKRAAGILRTVRAREAKRGGGAAKSPAVGRTGNRRPCHAQKISPVGREVNLRLTCRVIGCRPRTKSHSSALTESQRAMVAAKLANMPAHRPSNKSANLQTSQSDAAHLLNVATRTVAPAEAVKVTLTGGHFTRARVRLPHGQIDRPARAAEENCCALGDVSPAPGP